MARQLLLFVSLGSFLAQIPVVAQPGTATDFRQARWGMTQAQVLATESSKPNEMRRSSGEAIVQYDSVRLAGLDSCVIYIFANDKLVRAKYLFDVEHDNQNDFIADFRTVEPLLREKYGKPANERAIWTDDSTQDEPKSYLDQDRATPANILPSDRLVGYAVSLGHLKLYTQWQAARTKVLHALTGENHEITHQIEYRSVELESLENKTRQPGANPER
jgi:hypothetical protein